MPSTKRLSIAITVALAITGAVFLAASPTWATTQQQADHGDWVKASRATLRLAPNHLVLANARKKDRVRVQAQCRGWVRGQVLSGHEMVTRIGWLQRGHLLKASKPGGLRGVLTNCGQTSKDVRRWRTYVAAMNAPLHSYYTGRGAYNVHETAALWHKVKFPTGVSLASGPSCTPSYNYARHQAGERVDSAQPVSNVDLTDIAYRYVSRTGAVALVSIKRPGQHARVWAFVQSSCLTPKTGGKYTTVYFPNLVQLDRVPKDSKALRTRDLKHYGCHAGLRSPSQPQFGWWPEPEKGRQPGCPY
ncbi:hypothetical protein [Actinomadura luteofluorescens]